MPPLKEEVRKIGSRKVGTSTKRLLEGNDRVRELMVTRQNSTPIRTQCNTVFASSGGGVCHDPPHTQVDRDPSRQPAACARGTDSPKRPAGKGAGVQAGSRQRVRRFSHYRKFQQLQSFHQLRLFQQLQHVGRRQVPALEGFVQGLWNVGQTREQLGVPFWKT